MYRDGIVPVSTVSGSEPADGDIFLGAAGWSDRYLSRDPEVMDSPSRPKRMACGV